MPTDVEIRIVANGTAAAAEINKVNTALKGVQGQADKTTAATKQQTSAVSGLVSNWKSLAVTGGAVIGTLYGAKRAYDAVMNTTLAYAKEVKTLSAVSGESATETSRFIQVLDDYEISAGDALAATRILTKQGLAPNIATLAKLSDEYNALNSVEEKNAFILKNLGRGGLQWVNVLKQGSAAILAQGAAVNKNLLLDEQAIRKTEEYRLAVDNLNDAKQGLAVTIGTKVMPYLTKDIELFQDLISGEKSYIEVLKENIRFVRQHGDALDNQSRAYMEMARQAEAAAAKVSESNEEVSQSLEGILGLKNDLAPAFDDLKKRGPAAFYELDKAIKTATLSMLTQKFILSNGLDPTESAILDGLKKKWGILDEGVQGVSETISALTDRIAAGGADAIVALAELQAFINNMHGKSIDIIVNYLTSTSEGAGQSTTNPSTPTGGGTGGGTGTTNSGQPIGGIARGGQLNKGWSLVGDAPGGVVTPYSELISPSGMVYSAEATRRMLAGGFRATSGARGLPLMSGRRTGGTASRIVDTSMGVHQTFQGMQAAAHQAYVDSQNMGVALQQQAMQAGKYNESLLVEIRNLRRDISRSVRDAVQTVVR